MATWYDLVVQTRRRLNDWGGDVADNQWITDDLDCLWQNAELVEYLSEAEQEFTRRVPTPDITDSITQISVVADTATYALDDRIISVERARLVLGTRPLRPIYHADVDEMSAANQFVAGTVEYYTLDLRLHSIELFGTPSENDTLELAVTRRALTGHTWVDAATAQAASPDVPRPYHFDLVDWACYLAHLKANAQTQDLDRAAVYERNFDNRVGLRPSASLDRKRYEVANVPLRTVSYYR